MTTAMQFIDGAEIDRRLTFELLIDAIEAAHRRAPIDVADTIMGDEASMYFVRNAVDHGRFVGSKLITSTPGNLGSNLPAVQAVMVLFDSPSGSPLAVLDGTVLTQWRTAADSALGSRLLSRTDSSRLLVVGAGAMSRPLVRAHRVARPSLTEVKVWNRTTERAADVVADLVADGISASVVTDLEAAVRHADIVSCCTRSTSPLVRGEWLQPGTHLDLVGGFTPAHREADDRAMQRGRVFVDRRESAFDGVGDILTPIANGAITANDVLGDLHDLVAQRAGRVSADEITIFKNAGGGHLDLMTAEAILWAR